MLVLIVALTSCTDWPSLAVAAPPATNSVEKPENTQVKRIALQPWQPLFNGITVMKGEQLGEVQLKLFALKIDTRNPHISFFVTPSNGSAALDTGARTTSEFLDEFDCQVAINGSVFKPQAKELSEPLDILGLSVSNGLAYSTPNRFHALLIYSGKRFAIARPPFNMRQLDQALSGYYIILQNGLNVGSNKSRHPRSAIGLTQNGRYVIFLVIDGRQPGYSDGATLAETADLIHQLGAFQALNMDGGGSATLVVQGPDGRPNVLNRPSDGVERRVANHLCVYASKMGS